MAMIALARCLAVLVVLSISVCSAATQAEAAVTTTFGVTGAEQTYVVPANVHTIHVVAVGGKGGKGASRTGAPGGSGGRAEADLAVEPGQVLFVEVGGVGADGILGRPA